MTQTKLCLDSCVSFTQLNNAQTNFSKSKQAYSFGKSSRFKDIRSECNKSSYDQTNYYRNRIGASLGYGHKYDFTKIINVTPSPNIYRIKTEFQEDRQHHKGSTFQLGRQKIVSNNYLHAEQSKNPSSTRYCIQKYFKGLKNKDPSYTMRKKTKTIFNFLPDEEEEFNKPGPGAYNNPQLLTKNKQLQISKFSSVSFSTGKAKRFKTCETVAPGPGKYKEALAEGQTFQNSKFRNYGKVRFTNSKRNTYIDDEILHSKNRPGPGNYRAPSEFGIYDGNVTSFNGFKNISKSLESRPQTSK